MKPQLKSDIKSVFKKTQNKQKCHGLAVLTGRPVHVPVYYVFVVMCIVLAPLLVPRFPVYVYMCLGVCVRVCLEYWFISVRRFPVLKPATTAVHQASLAAADRHC